MSDGSLFDMASNKAHEEKKLQEKEKQRKALKPIQTQKEATELFEQFKKMHQELNARIENIYKEAKLTPDQVKEMISQSNNSNNFSKQDVAAIEKTKKENEQKLKKLASQLKGETKAGEPSKPKKKSKIKKGWMPMH
jgi:endonuclease/exonuclease/phosphatase (EEP) superfamily protein YafD